MVERGENFGFALKARETIGIARYRRGQHLDGDRALQVGIGGAIHLAHSTHANLRGDLIRAEADAGFEGHRR